MNAPLRHDQLRHDRRHGFTLIELMVVIVIIAVLAAFTLRIVGGVLNNARTTATKATLAKIQTRLKDRLENFARLDFDRQQLKQKLKLRPLGFDTDSASTTQITVLGRKEFFREAFPQTWAETVGSLQYLQDAGTSFIEQQNQNNKTESAEVLYWLLTKAIVLGFSPVDADEFTANEVGDTDGDGLLEFIDGWGQPLRFYHWPTRLVRPDGIQTTTDPIPGAVNLVTQSQLTAAKIVIRNLPEIDFTLPDTTEQEIALRERPIMDPDDPTAAMAAWFKDRVAAGDDPITLERSWHTHSTYHTPLVISAGEDGLLGLFEPNDTATFGHLAAFENMAQVLDNISAQNLQAGGN